MLSQYVHFSAETTSFNLLSEKFAMMEISTLVTDALPHVKLNLAILAQILKMFNLFAQRFVETATCRVHNLKFVMTEITQEETDAQ